jgi:glycine cleavage system H protein
MYPEDVRYTENPEWVGEEDGLYLVGISEYAQEQLGDVTYVELPEIGKHVRQKEPVALVESVKAAEDIYAPVTGVIVEVNEALEGEPELLNFDPYGRGWCFKMDDIDTGQYRRLMNREAYEKYLKSL